MARTGRLAGILFALAALLTAGRASAQYYDWGPSPASVRWRILRSDDRTLIFPDTFESGARRVMGYMDSVRPFIGYGFRYGPMPTPVVMHTQNFRSNGLVMWAPKRMELLTVPQTDTYSVPWLKQLSIHEYRHTVQYNNLNKGVIRVLSYLLGQQGSLVGVVFMPVWAIEGDAVQAETQMTTFGRALQPSFNIEYRAVGDVARRGYALDKWFCGSYRDNIPDHYQLGYQLCARSYDRFGEVIWDKVADFSSRRPYLLLSTRIALKKYYGITVRSLFHDTFDSLHRWWQSLPPRSDSSRIIPTPTTSYTTYSHPQSLNDTTIVALKSDFDRPSRLVAVHPQTGRERIIRHTGSVSSRPALQGRRIWWTEYRSSSFWEERVDSRLRYLDLDAGRIRTVKGKRRTLYPTPMGELGLATVDYDISGRYTIDAAGREFELSDSVSVHGLAWDERSALLYYIGLSDSGMWIGSLDPRDGRQRTVTAPAHITLSDLRAGGGRLWYGSVASGYDEVHTLDLSTGRRARVTTSALGSFDPAPTDSGAVMTTYTARGYLLARQHADPDTLPEEPLRSIPPDIVNPPHRKWAVPNLDPVRFTDRDDSLSRAGMPARKYRKGLRLFHIHSWAPVDIDPFNITAEYDFGTRIGLTLLSQDLLSSTTAAFNFGWTPEGGARGKAKIYYDGLAPKFELETTFGGGGQLVYTYKDAERPADRKRYFHINLAAYLPLILDNGYHTRVLTPLLRIEHLNALVYDKRAGKYRKGLDKLTASLTFYDNVRRAYRDFLPRWGYLVRGSAYFEPFRNDFSTVWSLYGRTYLPGIFRHHSLMLRANYQYRTRGELSFRERELAPRQSLYGPVPRHYTALAADYQLPLCYPDGGIPSILYFKRIRLNLGFDYAREVRQDGTRRHLTSWGGDLIFDLSPLRMPASKNTSFKLSLYRPGDRRTWVASAALTLPL